MNKRRKLLDTLEEHFLFPEHVDWPKLRKQSVDSKTTEEFLQTIIYHLNDPHARFYKIGDDEVPGHINEPSLNVKGKTLTITYPTYVTSDMSYLNKYYKKVYNIFMDNIINKIIIDISEFSGGVHALSFLFVKFLFQKRGLRGVLKYANRYDEIVYDAVDITHELNLKVKKIDNMESVKEIIVKMSGGTKSSGEMLCVVFLDLAKDYKLRYRGCDTIGIFNTSLHEIKPLYGYSLIFSRFFFVSSNNVIFKGSISVQTLNKLARKIRI